MLRVLLPEESNQHNSTNFCLPTSHKFTSNFVNSLIKNLQDESSKISTREESDLQSQQEV
jgi:hypothetical protein